MFSAPKINSEVFARLPDRLRVTDNPEVRFGHARDSFLEGPAFDRSGNLYCVDVPYGRIFRISPDGEFDVACSYQGRPNGLAIHKDGRIFVTDQMHGILVLDPASGRIEPFLESGGFERFKGPNDLVFNRAGDLYFTDQGQSGLQNPNGCVYKLHAQGRLDCLIATVPSPNGLVLSRDEGTLYLAVTRANAVWRVPLNFLGNGAVSRVGTYLQLSGGTGPDGMALGGDGSLAVAHIGFGTVWLFDPIGEPLARVQSCAGLQTSNVAFAGDGSPYIYITESGSGQILRARVPMCGLPLYSHG
jgi:gluconolactonase